MSYAQLLGKLKHLLDSDFVGESIVGKSGAFSQHISIWVGYIKEKLSGKGNISIDQFAFLNPPF